MKDFKDINPPKFVLVSSTHICKTSRYETVLKLKEHSKVSDLFRKQLDAYMLVANSTWWL